MCIFWYKCQGSFLRKVLSLLEHPKINFFSLFLLLYMQQSINCWTLQLTYIHQVWLHEQQHTTFLVKVCFLPFSMKWEYSSQFSMMIWRFFPFSRISYTSQIIQTVTSICHINLSGPISACCSKGFLLQKPLPPLHASCGGGILFEMIPTLLWVCLQMFSCSN